MQPADLLIAEHRLIQRMVKAGRGRLRSMAASGRVDMEFVDAAVDFIRTYADRLHHGKEEDILFREMAGRRLSPALRRRMADLVTEHDWIRQQATLLVAAKELYVAGSRGALRKVTEILRDFLAAQPRHLAKEERGFFGPVMRLFSAAERARMLDEMLEFDRRVIHEKYENLVDGLAAQSCRHPRAVGRAHRRAKR